MSCHGQAICKLEARPRPDLVGALAGLAKREWKGADVEILAVTTPADLARARDVIEAERGQPQAQYLPDWRVVVSPARGTVIPADVVALARWTAEYYAAGAGETITAVLPPKTRGERADAHAAAHGLEQHDPSEFVTERQRARLERWLRQQDVADRGTVGAVCLDADGLLAAATSTGGRLGQRPGRVGDSPLIG